MTSQQLPIDQRHDCRPSLFATAQLYHENEKAIYGEQLKVRFILLSALLLSPGSLECVKIDAVQNRRRSACWKSSGTERISSVSLISRTTTSQARR